MNTVIFQDLGNIEYGEAWNYQEGLMKKKLDLKAAKYAAGEQQYIPEKSTHHLLFCDHPHVYTLGKSGVIENLLLNDARLKELDISFYKTNRGGDITYHGPGQIVGYPILDLELFFTDLGKYMRCLEEVIIRTIANWGIVGDRLEGATGVWLEPKDASRARKICAMGVKCSRWVTIHGWALNVNTNMKYFDYIVPCGISDKSVTSMEKEIGEMVDVAEVKRVLIEKFAEVFEANMVV